MRPYLASYGLILCILCCFIQDVSAFVEGLYCGQDNCYDVLGVTREIQKSELGKIYRKLASKYHPDRVKGSEEEKLKAKDKFLLVATAYETLKDDESRKDYDYMLDHPEEYYSVYYRYYRRRVAPQVDVRYVIAATLIIISIVQYASSYQKYNEALSYLMTQPKYRLQASIIAKERGLISEKKERGRNKKSKEEQKEEEETIIRSIIAENIDIKGGYKPPDMKDILIIQLVFLPYTIFVYINWYSRWIWKFWINREEYGDLEKQYIIRTYLKMSQSQYDSLPENEKEEMINEELWIKEHFVEWKTHKESAEKEKLAESGKYKRYRRYMKNQGPGQISFLDDE